MRTPQRPDFRTAIQKPKARGVETLPYFWNPNRASIRFASDDVKEKVRAIGDDLSVVWNPVTERWQVFCEDRRMQHPVCSGWRLLFIHQTGTGGYMPPDERLLARIYAISAKHQGVNGKEYFERIVREEDRDRQARERRWSQDTIDAAMPSFDHSQISVAMHGKSNGNKFSTYHA